MKRNTTKHRRLGKTVTASVLAALALSAAGPAFATTGLPDTTYVIFRVRAIPPGPITLCSGDVLRIRAAVTVKISRIEGKEGSFQELTPGMTGALIGAAVQDSAVGTISPSSGHTLADADAPDAEFAFVAGQPGSTDIVLTYVPSAPLEKYLPPVPTSDPALKTPVAPTQDEELASQQEKLGLLAPQTLVLAPTPATVKVQVKVCETGYRVTVSSAWVIPGEARQIYAFGFLSTTAEPTPEYFSVWATMSNRGFWVGPCTATITYQDSQVNIQGRNVIETVGPYLRMSVRYGPVSSHTVESCAGGTSDSTDTPDDLYLEIPQTGGTVTLPHAGTSDATGTSTITITRLGP